MDVIVAVSTFNPSLASVAQMMHSCCIGLKSWIVSGRAMCVAL